MNQNFSSLSLCVWIIGKWLLRYWFINVNLFHLVYSKKYWRLVTFGSFPTVKLLWLSAPFLCSGSATSSLLQSRVPKLHPYLNSLIESEENVFIVCPNWQRYKDSKTPLSKIFVDPLFKPHFALATSLLPEKSNLVIKVELQKVKMTKSFPAHWQIIDPIRCTYVIMLTTPQHANMSRNSP